jgi:3-methyladenine DNA glycosylase AlkC
VITKIADIRPLLLTARRDPATVIGELRNLAASASWQTREVAATALVEIGKRHPTIVLAAASRWARDPDANVRRAASEGLRGIVQRDPAGVRPILEQLRADPERYVQKSVASVLRNASTKQPEFVVDLCREWARTADTITHWIVKEGLRKLIRLGDSEAVRLLQLVTPSA